MGSYTIIDNNTPQKCIRYTAILFAVVSHWCRSEKEDEATSRADTLHSCFSDPPSSSLLAPPCYHDNHACQSFNRPVKPLSSSPSPPHPLATLSAACSVFCVLIVGGKSHSRLLGLHHRQEATIPIHTTTNQKQEEDDSGSSRFTAVLLQSLLHIGCKSFPPR